MIIIEQTEGLSCPVLYCDLCNEKIEKATDGEYLIPDLKDGQSGKAVIGHYECTRRYEKAMGDMFGNMPLDHLILYLANNLKIDWQKTSENAALLSLLG